MRKRSGPVPIWAIVLVVFFVPVIASFVVMRFLRLGHPQGTMTYVHQDDPELDVAIETAQRSLPEFLARLKSPRPEDRAFAIQARLQGNGQSEFIWIDHLKANDKGFEGAIADKPALIPKKKGDVVQVTADQITDWTIVESDGSREGGYTEAVHKRRQQRGTVRYSPRMPSSASRVA